MLFSYLCYVNIFEENKNKNTSVESLGEFGLIDYLTKAIKLENKNSISGVGDDAAVMDAGEFYQLASMVVLTEGVHFNLAYTPLKHLGYKSVAVNISDICAMNGDAKQIIVGLAISNRFTVEAIEELY